MFLMERVRLVLLFRITGSSTNAPMQALPKLPLPRSQLTRSSP